MTDQLDFFKAPPPIQRGKWPSEQLADLMSCKVSWDDAAPAIRSWAAFYINEAARQLLAIPDKAKRQAALTKVPEPLRDRVRDEGMRVWRGR